MLLLLNCGGGLPEISSALQGFLLQKLLCLLAALGVELVDTLAAEAGFFTQIALRDEPLQGRLGRFQCLPDGLLHEPPACDSGEAIGCRRVAQKIAENLSRRRDARIFCILVHAWTDLRRELRHAG